MSMFCKVETQFKNTNALICALMETSNWNDSQIEKHNIPVNLIGYRGDVRSEKANIIIRKINVGSASNDIGFIKKDDGTYEAIISSFDRQRYGDNWIKTLKQNYAYHCIRLTQEAKGRKVIRTKLDNGRQRLEIKIGR